MIWVCYALFHCFDYWNQWLHSRFSTGIGNAHGEKGKRLMNMLAFQ